MFFSQHFGDLHTSTFPFSSGPATCGWCRLSLVPKSWAAAVCCAAWETGHPGTISLGICFLYLKRGRILTYPPGKLTNHCSKKWTIRIWMIYYQKWSCPIARIVCPISLMLQAPCHLGFQLKTRDFLFFEARHVCSFNSSGRSGS